MQTTQFTNQNNQIKSLMHTTKLIYNIAKIHKYAKINTFNKCSCFENTYQKVNPSQHKATTNQNYNQQNFQYNQKRLSPD